MGLKISNSKGGRSRVDVYGEIGAEVSAKQFIQDMREVHADNSIDLHIHSEGGSFFDGISIYNQLKQHRGHIDVIVDGLAASAASLIAMAGDTITMMKNTWMMIHEVHAGGLFYGNVSTWKKMLEEEIPRLERLNDDIVSVYSARWKGTNEELREAINREHWMNPDDAIRDGLADSVSDGLALAACADLSKFKYRNAPKALFNQEYYNNFYERCQRVA